MCREDQDSEAAPELLYPAYAFEAGTGMGTGAVPRTATGAVVPRTATPWVAGGTAAVVVVGTLTNPGLTCVTFDGME